MRHSTYRRRESYTSLARPKPDAQPFMIKGQTVKPQDDVKILGVVMDAKLKYKEHIWRASSRGLEAAMELRHLGGFSISTARHFQSSQHNLGKTK